MGMNVQLNSHQEQQCTDHVHDQQACSELLVVSGFQRLFIGNL